MFGPVNCTLDHFGSWLSPSQIHKVRQRQQHHRLGVLVKVKKWNWHVADVDGFQPCVVFEWRYWRAQPLTNRIVKTLPMDQRCFARWDYDPKNAIEFALQCEGVFSWGTVTVGCFLHLCRQFLSQNAKGIWFGPKPSCCCHSIFLFRRPIWMYSPTLQHGMGTFGWAILHESLST